MRKAMREHPCLKNRGEASMRTRFSNYYKSKAYSFKNKNNDRKSRVTKKITDHACDTQDNNLSNLIKEYFGFNIKNKTLPSFETCMKFFLEKKIDNLSIQELTKIIKNLM